jgi:archaeosortase B (VPXXXP-CTERM-specific)
MAPAAAKGAEPGTPAPATAGALIGVRTVLRAVAILLGLFCLYAVINKRLLFLDRWTAKALAVSLDLLGMHAAVIEENNLVTWQNGQRGFTIIEECTGVFGLWIFSAFILATPTKLRWRLAGVGIGAAVILVINQLRLVALALVQTFVPSMFDFAHEYLWQVLFIIVIVALFLSWLGKVDEWRRVSR